MHFPIDLGVFSTEADDSATRLCFGSLRKQHVWTGNGFFHERFYDLVALQQSVHSLIANLAEITIK
ncbi:hypothetical protein CCR97_20605 [Rhodoplanes elegans]|nr:hypothetical protein [Rhodoplanes elegans]